MWTNLNQYQDDSGTPNVPLPGEYVVTAEWFDSNGYPRYTEVHFLPTNPTWARSNFESIKGSSILNWGAEPVRNT